MTSERVKFRDRFRRFARARRRLLNGALAYRLGGLALAAGVAGLLLLGGWLPGALVNMALFVVLGAFLLGLLVTYAVRRERRKAPLTEAFFMEQLYGDLNSRLVSAWDFIDRALRTPLTEAVIERADRDLELAYEAQLDRTERNRRRRQFLVWLAVCVGLGLTPWFGFRAMAGNFNRSLAAVRDTLFPTHYALTPGAGEHVYRLGQEAEVGVRFSRLSFSEVRLVVQRGKEQPKPQSLRVGSDGTASTKLTSDVSADYQVHFEFGDRRSEPMTLIFTTPPSLVNMQTELIAPSYTRLLPRTLEGVQQRLLALPGTRITLGFTFTKELESATITWGDGRTLPLEPVGRFASVALVQGDEPRRASLQVRDRHGFAMDYPLIIELDVQNDERPRVLLPRHLVEDMPLLPAAVAPFGFGARVQDDYGVTRCILQWQKATVDNPTNVVARGEVERLISPPQPKAAVNFEKVFAALNLAPGDKVSFQVEVYDNRSPKAQVARSRRASFFVYQDELGGLTIKQLGFGSETLGHQRIAKSKRATAVKSPEGRRNSEKVRNEHEATVASSTRAPTLHGEYSQATRDYFRLLSGVSLNGTKEPQATTASDQQQPPPPDGNTAPPGGN